MRKRDVWSEVEKGVLLLKKTVCRVAAAIMALAMVFMFAGCDKSDTEVENLITEFEYACNTLDFDAALNCITPRVSDKIKIAVNIFGMFSNNDPEFLFEKLGEVLAGNSQINGTDFFESVQIEIKEIVHDEEYEDTIYVLAYVTYELAGEEYTKEAVFTCEYYTEKWYVSKFSFK